jgi:hypothetical protein
MGHEELRDKIIYVNHFVRARGEGQNRYDTCMAGLVLAKICRYLPSYPDLGMPFTKLLGSIYYIY